MWLKIIFFCTSQPWFWTGWRNSSDRPSQKKTLRRWRNPKPSFVYFCQTTENFSPTSDTDQLVCLGRWIYSLTLRCKSVFSLLCINERSTCWCQDMQNCLQLPIFYTLLQVYPTFLSERASRIDHLSISHWVDQVRDHHGSRCLDYVPAWGLESLGIRWKCRNVSNS